MSLYALIRNSYRDGKFRLSSSDVELQGHLDGNLCRCVCIPFYIYEYVEF